ncbi:MarC family protein [Psychrobacter sanguinis]|uniref:MarC family protein n=1 Tax=Psychrobacter sanguinis TaxID=861445 RepID=UPI002234466C|nr:MarC family protein [Psychrobacter sanguinis]
MEIYATALTLFLIMDPLGNIPIFLSVLDKVPEERRLRYSPMSRPNYHKIKIELG